MRYSVNKTNFKFNNHKQSLEKPDTQITERI